MRTNREQLLKILRTRQGATIREIEGAARSARVRTSLALAIRAGDVEVAFDVGRRQYRYYPAGAAAGELRTRKVVEVVV